MGRSVRNSRLGRRFPYDHGAKERAEAPAPKVSGPVPPVLELLEVLPGHRALRSRARRHLRLKLVDHHARVSARPRRHRTRIEDGEMAKACQDARVDGRGEGAGVGWRVQREAFRRGWPEVQPLVPRRVRAEVERYLRCGDVRYGFVEVT